MALEKVVDGGACACVLCAVCWLKWVCWFAGLLLDLQGIGKVLERVLEAARENLRPARPTGLLDRWTIGPGMFPVQGLSPCGAARGCWVISP